jgi:hypothetical protein
MSTRPTSHSSSTEILEGASTVLVGGGIVTMALFPLALPLIILTAAAAVPLVLLAVASGVLVAAAALPILLVRSVVRAAVRARPPRGAGERGRPSSRHRVSGPQPGET